jgi:type III pantothenate kinase
MRITFDLGNSAIKVGVFDGQTLVFSSYLDHPLHRKPKVYITWLKPLLSRFTSAEILIASVHPRLTRILIRALRKLSDAPIRELTYKSFPKFKLSVDRPKELGIDLIVDGIAANHEYHPPCIIVDLGTATKVIGIRPNEFFGVAIAPGIATSFKSLQQHTALIQQTTMIQPELVFGKNNKQSLSSGIILGQAFMIEGLIKLGREQLQAPNCPVIITGGYAPLLIPSLSSSYIHDPYLSLKGMQRC